MLHGLLRLRVSRFGLSVRFVAMLLAQIGRMNLATTGLLGVVAVTLALLGLLLLDCLEYSRRRSEMSLPPPRPLCCLDPCSSPAAL